MLGNIIRYYKGRVSIQAKGGDLEKFINKAIHDGIVFFNGRKLKDAFTGEVNARDFRRLRKAAKDAHIKLTIRGKFGFPFVQLRWQKRKGLILGLFIIFSGLVALSQFVLSVSVEGNNKVKTEKIVAEAEKLGVKPWNLKNNIDFALVTKQLQEKIPDLIWVTMEERGTNIRIRVVEKTLPEKVVYKGDLIAGKTGFVDAVILIQGQALVHEGQTVKKGQVLIKAAGGMTEYVFDVTGKAVARQTKVDAPAAKGFVRGRVWYSAQKEIGMKEDRTEKTGRIANGWGIKIKDRVIMITNQESPYSASTQESQTYALPAWRNWRFPVEIIKTSYEETQIVHVERSLPEARKLAEKLAREELNDTIPKDAKVLREKIRILTSEKGVEYLRFECETFEELAVYRH